MTEKDSKVRSKERYSIYAKGYVTSETHAKGHELDRLLDIAQPQAEWVALDIATGGGHTALKFAPHVHHVTASDLTPNMLAAAQEFIRDDTGITNVDFKLADAENLPFADDSFDLVMCRIAPHHFPNVQQFVYEVARVIKPDGRFILQDHVMPPNADAAQYINDFETLRDPSHHIAYSEPAWREMVENAGLTIYHTEWVVKRHELIKWAKRQGNSDETISELQRLLKDAPPIVADYMDAQHMGTDDASFVGHHIILGADKV